LPLSIVIITLRVITEQSIRLLFLTGIILGLKIALFFMGKDESGNIFPDFSADNDGCIQVYTGMRPLFYYDEKFTLMLKK
jgi:hypothetical protein